MQARSTSVLIPILVFLMIALPAHAGMTVYGLRDIYRLRIVLAHHYYRVDPEQVWVIATFDVSRRCGHPRIRLGLRRR